MKAKICFNNEIHKVSLVPETLEGLNQLVKKIFQNKLPEFITLQYLDSDGDKILMADEKDFEEFKIFASQNKSGASVAKIFVVPNEHKIAIQQAINNNEEYQIIDKESEVEKSVNKEESQIIDKEKSREEIQNEEKLENENKTDKIDEKVLEPKKEAEKVILNESVIEEAKEDFSFSIPNFEEKSFQSGQNEGNNSKILVDVSTLEQLMSSMLEKNLSKIVQATKEEASKANKKENMAVNQVIHYGVKCVGCQAPSIVGVRYKCTVCYQFNYCEKCEETIEHAHNFIKIKERNLFENIQADLPSKPKDCFFPPKQKKWNNKKKGSDLIFGEENAYFKSLKEKAEKLQKYFPKAEFEMLMVYLNGAPEDLNMEELIENYKH